MKRYLGSPKRHAKTEGRPLRRAFAIASVMALCCWSTLAGLQAQAAKRSVRDGVYSQAQAGRGAKVFETACLGCHQPSQLASAWEPFVGQTLDQMFDSIQNTMPQDRPGGLTRDEYADVISFIFKTAGLPSGDSDLESAAADLKAIVIEPPARPGGLMASHPAHRQR